MYFYKSERGNCVDIIWCPTRLLFFTFVYLFVFLFFPQLDSLDYDLSCRLLHAKKR